jgi:hypothetical protein
MKAILPMEKMCFASCVRVARLLKILPEAARRAVDGEVFLTFPVGRVSGDDFTQATMNVNNLTRRGIFRGKISQRKNQPNITDLEERTQFAPNS